MWLIVHKSEHFSLCFSFLADLIFIRHYRSLEIESSLHIGQLGLTIA